MSNPEENLPPLSEEEKALYIFMDWWQKQFSTVSASRDGAEMMAALAAGSSYGTLLPASLRGAERMAGCGRGGVEKRPA